MRVDWFTQAKPRVLERGAYDIAMIDVPWRWKNYSKAHNWRSPEAKYDTMTMEQAAALPVRQLIRRGGFVWVWCTWPLLADQSMIVQNAWGLRIASGAPWVKRTSGGSPRMTTGLIFRGVSEPFLICCDGNGGGIRGRRERAIVETVQHTAELIGRARQHSRKPDEAYALCERLTPGWKRADVFARQVRRGWAGWGDQLGTI